MERLRIDSFFNDNKFSLQSEFYKFGPITDVFNTGKGYAFITFQEKESADLAIREMDGATLNGQQIKVSVARPRQGGRGAGCGYGGGGRGNQLSWKYFHNNILSKCLQNTKS